MTSLDYVLHHPFVFVSTSVLSRYICNLVTSRNMLLYWNHNNMCQPMYRLPNFSHRILQFKFRWQHFYHIIDKSSHLNVITPIKVTLVYAINPVLLSYKGSITLQNQYQTFWLNTKIGTVTKINLFTSKIFFLTNAMLIFVFHNKRLLRKTAFNLLLYTQNNLLAAQLWKEIQQNLDCELTETKMEKQNSSPRCYSAVHVKTRLATYV